MAYVPLTPDEREAMLARIGASSVDDLFAVVPPQVRFPEIPLPPAASEQETGAHVGALARQNRTAHDLACFRGAGAYFHYVPAAVGHITGRSEFYTSYTPYQSEASQGILQATFEFQSLVADLFGLDVANASVYDGASALAEAVLMALRLTRRSRIAVSASVHPEYRAVVRTYLTARDVEVRETTLHRTTDGFHEEPLADLLDDETACCVVQQPDFFGRVHDFTSLVASAKARGALVVAVCNPTALGLLQPPGAWGADIAVAEGQPLGIPLSFGGPFVGLMACRLEHVRQLPGRLVGQTTDRNGRRGFVLTLQAREQHIRREKATSNICTNEALMALAVTVYLALLGPQGLRRVAELCHRKTRYLASRIAALPGYRVLTPEPFFHEIAVACPVPPRALNERLLERGILGGVELGRWYPALDDSVLFCCTEMNSRQQIDALAQALDDLGRPAAPAPREERRGQ